MPTLPITIDARKAKSGANEFNRSVDGVVAKSNMAVRSVAKFGAGVLGVGTAAIAAAKALTDFSRVNKEFEKTMAEVQAVSGATGAAFAVMNAEVRKLGASTRYSAKEAGDALLFLTRAGFSTTEALTALPGTLDLATAGVLELGEAADIASNVLAQFALETDEMSRVGDVLVGTANRANTDVRQLAEALKLAGPVAAATGQSLEETAAAAGALGNAGIQASLAGTNLRGMMSGLLAPTDAAADAIKSLGLSVEELNPSSNTLIEIFDRLQGAGMGATEAVQIFARRNAAAAIVLAGNVETIKELNEALNSNQGEATAAARIMGNTYAGAILQLKSAWEELLLTLGETGAISALKTVIQALAQAVRDVARVTGEMTGNRRLQIAGMGPSALAGEIGNIETELAGARRQHAYWQKTIAEARGDAFAGPNIPYYREQRDARTSEIIRLRRDLAFAQDIQTVRTGLGGNAGATTSQTLGRGQGPMLPTDMQGALATSAVEAVQPKQDRLTSSIRRTDRASRSLWSGYIAGATNAEQLGIRVANTFSNNMAGALVDAAVAGKNFGDTMVDMAKTVTTEIAKLTTQLLILRAVAGIASFFGSAASGQATVVSSAESAMGGSTAAQEAARLTSAGAPQAAGGGIFTGPETGYPVILHGTEEVRKVGEPSGGLTVVVEQHNNFSMLDGRTVNDKVLQALAAEGKRTAAIVADELARNPNMRASVA